MAWLISLFKFRLAARCQEQGQSLVELLIAIGISAIILPALITGFVASREGRVQQNERLRATALLAEAVNAVRVAKEADWNTFALNGTYHPVISGSTWILASGSETVSGFTRSIVIGDVRRDSNGNIVGSGGDLDPSSKKLTAAVTWNAIYPSRLSSAFYLMRYVNNIFLQTTEADFNAGTKGNVVVTDLSGGEVTLGSGGRANWCEPNLSIAAFDLPKQGVANGITAIEGLVFAGTGNNASGESYAKVTLSNTDPPVAALSGTFSNYKTNGVFGEASYGYLATDTNSKEIVILDISQNPFREIGYFDSPGPTDANSIFIAGNVGYMTAGDKFYTFDLTGKIGSRSQLGSVNLAGTGTKAAVVGNYAYVAIGSVSTQLQIIDVTNPQQPNILGQAKIDGQGGVDVFVDANGARAYLATAFSTDQPEVFILDVTGKVGDQPTVASYDTGSMNPKGITVVPGNRAIVVGIGGEEYQVIDISTENTPSRCGGLNLDTGINGIASVLETDGDAYSYIITGDVAAELKIIEGGPGGKFAAAGVFESSTFDATKSAAFNWYQATVTEPPQTAIKFQFAANDPAAGSCLGVDFTFIGPDGTDATYYATSSGQLVFSNDNLGFENPARCLRYKVFLSSSDYIHAPTLWDMTINYSL